MFSVAGTMPTTLIGSCSWLTAFSVPSTEAAPHMSNFISSIAALGLIEIPPVSKVTPLPTRAIGFCLAAAPRYSSTISFAGWRLPALTDSSEPIFSRFIAASSSTLRRSRF